MANRHQRYDLKQMQSVPLEGKILMTQDRIRRWYDYWDGKVYVSFSGGKDSTVLKHIVDSLYDDVRRYSSTRAWNTRKFSNSCGKSRPESMAASTMMWRSSGLQCGLMR